MTEPRRAAQLEDTALQNLVLWKEKMMSRKMTLMFATLVLSFNSTTAECQESRSGVVISTNTPLFGAPSIDAQITKQLPFGTELSVGASSGGLFAASLSTGENGWVPAAKVGFKIEREGKICLEFGLEKGISEGVVDADFQGTGNYAGDSATVTITSKVDLTVDLCPTIEKTLILAPGPGERHETQSLIVRSIRGRWPKAKFDASVVWSGGASSGLEAGFTESESTFLPGEKGASEVFLLEAYCIDPDKGIPNPGLPLKLDRERSEAGLEWALEANVDDDARLVAIWLALYEEDLDLLPFVCDEVYFLGKESRTQLDRLLVDRDLGFERVGNLCS